jgi:heat shock protein HslJ
MRKPLSLVLAAVLVAGCGPANPGPTPSGSGGTTDEVDGSWQLSAGRTAEGRLPLARRPAITLVVAAGDVSGTSACNQYSGTTHRRAAGIRFEGLGGTEMGCDPAVMELEQRYLAALAAVDSAAVDATDRGRTRLVLTGPAVRLRYESLPAEAGAALVGTVWHLETLLDGQVASSTTGDGRLELDDGGHLAGTAGCLPFEGRYAVTGGRVTVRDLGTPGGMTDCSAQSQHDAVLTILAADPTFTIEGSTLTLRTTDGRGLVYFA